MSSKSDSDDDVNGNGNGGGGGVAPPPSGENCPSSLCSTCSIEVCQGPDCTGLGGGAAILEIEELVREHHFQSQQLQNHSPSGAIEVVAGGCRDFCSVGPNTHVLRGQYQSRRKRTRTINTLLDSFSNVKDASSCDKVVRAAIARASNEVPAGTPTAAFEGTISTHKPSSSSSSSTKERHLSMVARRAERTRWEALKDVARTIAGAKKTVVGAVAAAGDSHGGGIANNDMNRKRTIWTRTCKDRIYGAVTPSSPRDQRRAERLVGIASERLDRICLRLEKEDDESDSGSHSSSINCIGTVVSHW
jgi:hypothetical protein